MSSFLKQYVVKFWTTDGQLTSMVIGAMNAAAAIEIACNLPNFDSIAGYPEEVG